MLIEKRVVDFPLVLIVYCSFARFTAEPLRANIDW